MDNIIKKSTKYKCFLDDNTVVKLSEDVLVRIEYDDDNVLLFLHNSAFETFWIGDFSSALFIKQIDGKKNIGSIANILKKHFVNYTTAEIKKDLYSLILELLDNKYLKIVNV